MLISDLTRLILFKVIIQQSTAEGVAGRRFIIRRTLERIREGSATSDEVAIIHSALQLASKLPGTTEDKRSMAALVFYYLSAEPCTARSIAEDLNICTKSFYRDINRAIDILTVAVFGIDGVEFQ